MSRIGKKPIEVPAGTTVVKDGNWIKASGLKGELQVLLLPNINVDIAESQITLSRNEETPETQRTYGLMRTLIDNIVVGVSRGYERKLEINGVGFRASVGGRVINLALGFSHPVVFDLPDGVDAKVEKNIITISGNDKQLVGQVAANIRSLKKPEPYKGKGIKYIDEHVRRKAGKTAAKG